MIKILQLAASLFVVHVLATECQDCELADVQLLQIGQEIEMSNTVEGTHELAGIGNAKPAVPPAKLKVQGLAELVAERLEERLVLRLEHRLQELENMSASKRVLEALSYVATAQSVAPAAEYSGAGAALEVAKQPMLAFGQASAWTSSQSGSGMLTTTTLIVACAVALAIIIGCIFCFWSDPNYNESEQNKAFLNAVGANRARPLRKDCC
eukprot:TRINITY_DN9805_c0_g1_i1.p1 TRINITY_DN9805_c0_g1~~TRINITY_DN9805_c0_g1_i1.p1  ORF type:complete len:210 (+),score=46.63 TRINITY_DN9805_c0_g1_i1:118-747(+)